MLQYNKLVSLVVIMIFGFLFLGAGKSNNHKFDNFSLYSFNNEKHSLSDFTDKNGIVLIFVSTRCPVSKAYDSRMSSISKKFGDQFHFVGINSNKQEDVDEIKDHATKNDLDFVILKDKNNVIADKFEASVTPEVYVLNNGFELLYHGRIDDSRREGDVESNDLEKVLNEIKKGEAVSVKKTKAFGCSIKRVDK